MNAQIDILWHKTIWRDYCYSVGTLATARGRYRVYKVTPHLLGAIRLKRIKTELIMSF